MVFFLLFPNSSIKLKKKKISLSRRRHLLTVRKTHIRTPFQLVYDNHHQNQVHLLMPPLLLDSDLNEWDWAVACDCHCYCIWLLIRLSVFCMSALAQDFAVSRFIFEVFNCKLQADAKPTYLGLHAQMLAVHGVAAPLDVVSTV